MSVLLSPLAVVDDSRGQGVEVEVRHAVRADDHGCPLLVEGGDHLGEGVGAAVEVVAVELHGEASALRMVHGEAPAASYAQVGACGGEVDEACVLLGQGGEEFGGAVGGMVVDDDDVVPEVRLLAQCGAHGVGYGSHAVLHGDDDGCLYGEAALAEVGAEEFGVGDVGPCLAQVLGEDHLHLALHVSLCGVDVVELLLSRRAAVGAVDGVEGFADVHGQGSPHSVDGQRQRIEGGVAHLPLHAQVLRQLSGNPHHLLVHHQHGAHVEVAAQASRLVVDEGMQGAHSLVLHVVVGIDDACTAVLGHPQHTLHGAVAEAHGTGRGEQQAVLPPHAQVHQPKVPEVGYGTETGQHLAPVGGGGGGVGPFGTEQEDGAYEGRLP